MKTKAQPLKIKKLREACRAAGKAETTAARDFARGKITRAELTAAARASQHAMHALEAALLKAAGFRY